MKILVAVGFTSLAIFFCSGAVSAQREDRVSITVCNLEIPEQIKHANATFSESFIFKLGDDGRPREIKPLTRRYVVEESVADCLSDWKLPGKPGTRFYVSFSWVHGVGWTGILISSTEFKQSIKIRNGIGYGGAAKNLVPCDEAKP